MLVHVSKVQPHRPLHISNRGGKIFRQSHSNVSERRQNMPRRMRRNLHRMLDVVRDDEKNNNCRGKLNFDASIGE
jgi:hypothetical protein